MFKRLMRSKHLKTRAIWILTLFLIPPFLFFFSNSGNDTAGAPGGAAGIVFGRKIPFEQYQDMYRLMHQNMESQLGGSVPETFEPYLREQAWDRIILSEEARRTIKIDDQELATHIQTLPTFQENGRFSRDLYFRYVRALGYSPRVFEEHLRDDLRIKKLLDQIKAGVTVGDQELKAAFMKDEAKVRAAVVAIREADVREQVRRTLTERDIAEAYTRFASQLRTPEQRTVDWIGLTLDEALRQQPEPTDEQLRAYYEAHQNDFKDDAGAVRPLEDAKDRVRDAARAEAARTRLTDVALDFEDARDQKLTLEEIAAGAGLTIKQAGPIEPGSVPSELSPAVVEPVFNTSMGKLTDVVSTGEAVYLLRPVTEVAATLPDLQHVRPRVEQLLLDERTREAVLARAQQLRDEAAALRQGGVGVEESVKALGVTAARPEPFGKSSSLPELAMHPEALGLLVKTPLGAVSEVVQSAEGQAFAFIEESIPPSDQEFADRKEAYRATYEEQRRQERLTGWIADVKQRAKLKTLLQAPAPSVTTPVE